MKALLAILLMTGAGAICAASDDQDYSNWVNKKIEATRLQDLHATVRTGLFCEYAKPDIDLLQPGERLLVLETKTAKCGFFMKHQYLRVKRLRSDTPTEKLEGFIRVEASQNKVRITE